MRLLLLPLPLHALSAAFFGWSGAHLVDESLRLRGWQSRTELALAVAAAGLSLLSLRAMLGLLLSSPTLAVRGRRPAGDYVTALGVVAVLGLVASRLGGTPGREALPIFCVGFAAWLLAVTFDLLPRLFLGERRVSDGLGRVVSWKRLEWFEVHSVGGRAGLRLGKGDRVLVAARVVSSDAQQAREFFLQRGLCERRHG